jgi:nitrate/nitrite-specific signal transduction histidine kinase
MTGSVVMMPYQVYRQYQAERTKTAAEIRRADEQLGELSRAFSSAWQHATRPQAVLRALAGAVARYRAGHQPVRSQQCTQPHGLRRADA